MRSAYRVLALLIALGVVVQAALIAVAWFTALHALDGGAVIDKNYEGNWAHTAHGEVVGTAVIPLLALALLVVSFFARVPGGVRWALITFGVVVLQILFAVLGFLVPVLGLLHGVNAFALAAVASIAARKARVAATTPAAERATQGTPVTTA
jgi:hypothetical protein